MLTERRRSLASGGPHTNAPSDNSQKTSTSGYKRSAAVVEATLRRAKGICEQSKQPAPFKRKSDGSPYLEVHHWTALCDSGSDTLDNTAALCPNCHREVHHG